MKIHTMPLQKNSGFTLVEAMVVLVIVAVIVSIAAPRITQALNDLGDKKFVSQADLLIKGARDWKGDDTTVYTGITVAKLSADEYIPKTYGDGLGKNPENGDWVLSPNTDPTKFNLVAKDLNNAGQCNRLVKLLKKQTYEEANASCSTTTLTLIVK